jgi:hypothetical protein
MSAEAIARVVDDFRRGRVTMQELAIRGTPDSKYWGQEKHWISEDPVIDATALFREIRQHPGRTVDLYADHLLRPPLDSCSVAYVNDYGNVVIAHVQWIERGDGWGSTAWATDNPVDWDEEVEWVAVLSFWLGGRSTTSGGPIRTTGPVFGMSWAVRADGTPADLRWMDVTGRTGPVLWQMATVVVMRCVTFLNCRNVVVTEPVRPRPVRRCLARLGVTVNEVTIAKVGAWARTAGGRPPAGAGVPLTTVRGHLARYGVDGRGLLFGKIAGTFWIPAHARGSAEFGERLHDYALEGSSDG